MRPPRKLPYPLDLQTLISPRLHTGIPVSSDAIMPFKSPIPYRDLAIVEVYDPATDTWTTAPDMLTGRCGVRTSVAGGKIYAFGGYMNTWLSAMCVTVEEYDTGLNVSVSPPDFNGDGKFDIEDLIILIESWNQDDPVCDIVPRPFGDCIVDTLDLELLMSYWEQTLDDPSFAAHWALDEVDSPMVLGRFTGTA